ncbi:16S rRNA (cytosine(967)-C(5))-methyltransferase RsmB [Alkalilimnicola ehrlichii]|uniref:16S rRNA (cytosine(967)-C(5))-methyltransferase RsmB n=1 Tax=Alkalilimnicola ehrlichii TaxID=351052 RepID=UPI0026D6A0B4|nr:16S rRNA (cytosine(967)-C(5))-methyltransferase RsmB [Alkalilimnicola ehrlichii]
MGLINALLRRFLREQEALRAAVAADPAIAYSHPRWLLQRLQKAWPEQWEEIVTANNAHPPMTLRVNARRGSRDAYLARLQEAGIEAVAHPLARDTVQLSAPVPVDRLPGFADGDVSVQDAAAQLAADLLAAPAGARVLDACAAPGGKACHVLERQPDLAELWAVDVDAARSERINENLTRLGLAANVVVADAAEPEAWWDGQGFERILIDAPCSGSGVIRRHPDIKWLRRDSDIAALAAIQKKLLLQLWPLLVPGGKLVYVTCSVFPEENDRQIREFVAATADARVEPLACSDWGAVQSCGVQLLPGRHNVDGFYYACLSKG